MLLGEEVEKTEGALICVSRDTSDVTQAMQTQISRKVRIQGEKIEVLTTSKPLPLNILSVVATTFPPFRCKSHMILLLEICGNICCIRPTSSSRARMLFALLRFTPDAAGFEPEKKRYRIANAPTNITMRSCGMFTVCSDIMDIVLYTYCSKWAGNEMLRPRIVSRYRAGDMMNGYLELLSRPMGERELLGICRQC